MPLNGYSDRQWEAAQNNGTISAIANNLNSARSQTYSYDQLNRVSTANAGSLWGYTYGYDTWGNLLSMTPTSGISNTETALNVSANASNQLQANGLTYDADGRMKTDNNGNSYTYDAEGRILTAAGYTYTYDGDGVRVKKAGGSGGRLYWPDKSGKPANETDLGGGTQVRNVYAGKAQIARQAAGSWTYYLHDHLGSTRLVLTALGAVLDDVDYYPFGGVAYNSGSTSNLYSFTGYETDTESSTNYAVFRNQSSTMGRFLRPDPYGGSYSLTNPQSLNRYSYVLNNPVILIDPSGLDDSTGSGDSGCDPSISSCDPTQGGGGGGGGGGEGGGTAADPPPGSPPGYYQDQYGNIYYYDGTTLSELYQIVNVPACPLLSDCTEVSSYTAYTIPTPNKPTSPAMTPEQQHEAHCFAITASVKTLTVTATANGLVAAGAVAVGTFIPVTAPAALPFAAITGGIAGIEALGAAGLDLYGFVSGCK